MAEILSLKGFFQSRNALDAVVQMTEILELNSTIFVSK